MIRLYRIAAWKKAMTSDFPAGKVVLMWLLS